MIIFYILVRIVVRSKMLGEQLVLMVRTIVRVFLQKYMDCLGKKCVWMIEDFGYLQLSLDFLGMLSVGTGVGVIDWQF